MTQNVLYTSQYTDIEVYTRYRMSLFLYSMNRGEQLHFTFQHRGPVWSSGSDH